MTTVAIFPENTQSSAACFRAVAGDRNATGKTAGEALDALTAQIGDLDLGNLLLVKGSRPDRFFTAAQLDRLRELMARLHATRNAGEQFPAADFTELTALIDLELKASANRACAIAEVLKP